MLTLIPHLICSSIEIDSCRDEIDVVLKDFLSQYQNFEYLYFCNILNTNFEIEVSEKFFLELKIIKISNKGELGIDVFCSEVSFDKMDSIDNGIDGRSDTAIINGFFNNLS